MDALSDRDLMSVPDDLRGVLEQALSEEASPDNLELYLPNVRSIIKNLLQGLRVKQHDYKISGSRRSDTPHSGHERSDSTVRSERGDRTSSVSRGSAPHGSQRNNTYRADTAGPLPVPVSGDHWVGGFAPPAPQGPGSQPQHLGEYPPQAQAPHPNRASSRSSTSSTSQHPYGRGPQAYIHQPVHEEMTEDESSRQQAVPRRPHARSLSKTSALSTGVSVNDGPPRIATMPPQLPPLSAEIKRYSLADNPVIRTSPPLSSSQLPNVNGDTALQPQPSPGGFTNANPPQLPNVLVESNSPAPGEYAPPPAPPAQPTINRPMSPSPPPDTPTSDGGQTELNDKALSALKSREALSRRASKRFSTYTYNKMTSSSSAPTTATTGSQLKNRRSMITGNALLTAGELNALSEAEEAPGPNKSQRSRTLDVGRRSGIVDVPVPPVPPLPSTVSRFLPSTAEETAEEVSEGDKPTEKTAELTAAPKTHSPQPPPSPAPTNRPFTIFLQLESQVRKAEFEPGMTIAALRILFVEKFAYNPGLDNFPDIYIRDPTSQVMYELEDINEVKEKSLLSLNIERECFVIHETTVTKIYNLIQLWVRSNSTLTPK
jgi:hypothetical protein